MEIIGSLGVITNVTKMANLAAAKGNVAAAKRDGFRELFGVPVTELTDPAELTERGIVCIERYFNLVGRIFHHDWPDAGSADHGSSFAYLGHVPIP
jgi:hypothetical protein